MVVPDVASSRGPLTGRSVLVIEDEYFLADDIAREFTALGAEVIGPVSAIEEAQRILSSGRSIDGALLDINIKNEMIFPLARRLRSLKVPFVFTTGYDKNALSPEFEDIQLWEKPLDLGGLARSLARLMPKG